MRSIKTIEVGELRVVRRSDGGVYVGLLRGSFLEPAVRVGSSAAVCDLLGDALKEIAKSIREMPNAADPYVEPDGKIGVLPGDW